MAEKRKRQPDKRQPDRRQTEKRQPDRRSADKNRKEYRAKDARRETREWEERVPQQYEEEESGLLIGRNPVMEALKSGRNIDRLTVLKDAEGSVVKIVAMAREKNIIINYADRSALDRIASGAAHQGVIAHASEFEYCEVEDILEAAQEKGEPPFIIVLDGIEDPHNLGAIIRTADAAGAHGVIIPKRRAAMVTATVEKSSAGASAYMKVAKVSNIAQTLEMLKKEGVWTAATDMDGELYTRADLSGPVAVVIGSEGKGISRLVKETCDFCVSIPMKGGVNSLNASNAAAVLMYEVVRRRDS